MDGDKLKEEQLRERILVNAVVSLEKFFKKEINYNRFSKEVIGYYKAYRQPLATFARKFAK